MRAAAAARLGSGSSAGPAVGLEDGETMRRLVAALTFSLARDATAPAVPPSRPLTAHGSQPGASPAWKQSRFVISMCLDPIVEPDQLEYRYQEMADANFTMVSSSAWLTPSAARAWDATTRMAHGLTALRAAEDAGRVDRRPRRREQQRRCRCRCRCRCQ